MTNGPAPTLPSGTGGDFRFHSAWWESATDLYHMRAREYDQRLGRFMSRDPRHSVRRVPESLNLYVFAFNNSCIYSDPTGEFTIDISLTAAINGSLQAMRVGAVAKARKKVFEIVGGLVKDAVVKKVGTLMPGREILSSFKHGTKLGSLLRRTICANLPAPDTLFVEVPITVDGRPLRDGLTCNEEADSATLLELAQLRVPRPDFVIGPRGPHSAGSFPKTWVIGEIKSSTATLYRSYIRPGSEPEQFFAILNYADKHTYSRSAIFITAVKGKNPPSDAIVIAEIGKSALSKKVFPVVVRIVD